MKLGWSQISPSSLVSKRLRRRKEVKDARVTGWGWAGAGVSACRRWWCTWIALWGFGVARCGLGVRFTLWSVTCLGGDGVVWGLGFGYRVGSCHCCCCFFFLCRFLARGSGLSTPFYVTSLYVDAASLEGPRHAGWRMRGNVTIKKKKI